MADGVSHDYIAGCVAGTAGMLCGYPFDTAKVMLQVQSTSTKHQGTWEAVKLMFNRGMVQGMFRGMSFPLLNGVIQNTVYFGVYGHSLKVILGIHESNSASYAQIFAAGCIAGVAQTLPMCPTEVVKCTLQAQVSNNSVSKVNSAFYKGPIECVRYVHGKYGLRGFFRGLPVLAVRDSYSFGFYILTYEVLFNYLSPHCDSAGVAASLIAGGCSGVIAWMSIMPFDVIKSRLQSDMIGQYRNAWDCAMQMYLAHGVRVFFNGTLITSLRAFPVNAVTFLAHSQTLKYLNQT